MVRITNGTNTFKVPESTFKSIFKTQGYRLVDMAGEVFPANPTMIIEEDKNSSVDELLEKPINNWSKAEVKAFAVKKKISLVGTKSVSEAKGVIRKWIDENL